MDAPVEYALVSVGLVFTLAGIALLAVALLRRNRKSAIFAVSFLAVAAVLLGRLGYAEFWEVDRCLDSGGRFDRETGTCLHG